MHSYGSFKTVNTIFTSNICMKRTARALEGNRGKCTGREAEQLDLDMEGFDAREIVLSFRYI
jgi:hypothetical protein